MVEPNLIGGLLGGVLIGIAATLLLVINGRIAGISGILGGVITSNAAGERFWRLAFVAGLIGGAGLYALVHGLAVELQTGTMTLIVAGFLVGFGTRVGSGCTSGHGVCGLARHSPRSLAATSIFMSLGVVTVYLMRHLFS